jgi:hypothetical protein
MTDPMDDSKNETIEQAQWQHEQERPTVVCGGCGKVIFAAGPEVEYETCYRCEAEPVRTPFECEHCHKRYCAGECLVAADDIKLADCGACVLAAPDSRGLREYLIAPECDVHNHMAYR